MSKTKTLKYLLVGDSGVGKTTLLMRYCDDTFQYEYLSTIGVDFKIKPIMMDGTAINLNIWDTAGQERFRNITRSFYKGADGILLLYSLTDYDSFAHIEKWIEQIQEAGTPHTVMMLVAAKCDVKERRVSWEEGKALADKYDIPFIEVSAKNNTNVQQVFDSLTRHAIGSLTQPETPRSTTSQSISQYISPQKKKKKGNDCC